jgi:hypothetical protein
MTSKVKVKVLSNSAKSGCPPMKPDPAALRRQQRATGRAARLQ